MTKLLYIASNAHSGSTLLEMLLSAHPSVCGLGESHMLIDDRKRPKRIANADERICSCLQPISECPLWSRFIEYVEQERSGRFATRYQKLISMVQEEFGEDVVIADSSKYIEPLNNLLDAIGSGELPQCEIFVIHVVKDVRAFATSVKRLDGIRGWRVRKAFSQWWQGNRQMQRLIDARAVRHVRVGYDELCLNPELVLRIICDAAGIAFDGRMLDMANTRAHIGVGNPMRSHRTKSRKIIYDSRWFLESDVNLWYLLRPRIRRDNERWVHQNLVAKRNSRMFEPTSSADTGSGPTSD